MYQIQRDKYLHSFPDDTAISIRKLALQEARENRRFEIELYWKRAGYFWVFISATFGGYAALQIHEIIAFLLACLGFIFSLAWYFVNRGSKFWQENWELHVDLLENSFAGPIYKTVVQRSESTFWKLNGPYPFSVSKINQLLSVFVIFFWCALLGRSFGIVWGVQSEIPPRLLVLVLSAFTAAAAIVLWCAGRTRDSSGDDIEIAAFYQRRRTYR
jgi:lipopolysaccharide export LptBFGC system permease protein LptF